MSLTCSVAFYGKNSENWIFKVTKSGERCSHGKLGGGRQGICGARGCRDVTEYCKLAMTRGDLCEVRVLGPFRVASCNTGEKLALQK